MTGFLRLFIGIGCSPNQAVRSVLDALSGHHRQGVAVVPPSNLHITLKFLGAVPEQRLQEVTQILDGASTCAAFSTSVSGAGSFRQALWLGVRPDPKLCELAGRLDAAASDIGFSPERRPYVPHLTVARLKPGNRFDRQGWEERHRRHWQDIPVDRITLFRSDPAPGGVLYTSLHQAALTDRDQITSSRS